jgi:hypothetical protein
MTNIFPDETIKMARDLSNECKEDFDYFYNGAEEIKSMDETGMLKKEMRLTSSIINKRLEGAFNGIAILMTAINIINSDVDKMAHRDEVNAVKAEITKKVKATLEPIKKELDEAKEREKRGASVYE